MTRFAGGPSQSPGFLMWHATMSWQRTMTATLAPLGLTHVQFVLLACAWWLASTDEPPTQVRLAAQAGTDVKMTSDVVARLEGKGLVRRAAHPTDARAKVVTVTDEGAALARRAIEEVEAADAEFFAAVDTPALVTVLATLAASG
ncbi:MarR family transcriptional regulator [Cellulomonas chitinilytica]|uniref:MarR family transcriptional regulator n=1 Tax=Cellulomonas chitinilytica TaxID=398759 RepID=A0A919U0Z4_9CELL|nr:MarR family transcriptional regulator [Cellulomonas chitinilytica]GIG23450.1 MarR family transcriptional regulator [Cellulomonas chitinilytica]